MRNCIKRSVIGILLLLLAGALLLWQGQSTVADKMLSHYLPELQYQQVMLDSRRGQLMVHGVKLHLPGVTVHGGDVDLRIDPKTLLHGPVVINMVTLSGVQVTLDPSKFSSHAEAAADGVVLPKKVIIRDAVVTVVAGNLPHLRALHLDGDAVRHGKGWSFQSTLTLSQGVLHSKGVLAESLLQGDLKIEGSSFSALLQQLGVAPAPLDLYGGVDGSLRWKLRLSAADSIQIEGDLHLHSVAMKLQNYTQRVDDVALQLAWRGEPAMLQIHQMKLRGVALHWSQKLQQPSASNMDSAFAPHWQLDQLSINRGSVDVDIATAAGPMALPLRVKQIALQGMRWNQWWPQRGRVQATLLKGVMDLSLRGQEVDLKLQGVPLASLQPLILSATALHIPQGALDVRLQGALAPKLKLFGALVVHHLVLAPRIPVKGVDLSIPYAFGLRALTDDHGVTSIPLAIRGAMAHPDLDVEQIVTKVKKNLFNSKLDQGFYFVAIDVVANQTVNHQQLTPTGEQQLAKLIVRLQENPALRMTIRGCVHDRQDLSDQRAQRLAAARAQMVRSLLQQRLHRDVVEAIIYPTLTTPSPDIDGKKDRVEVSIYPRNKPFPSFPSSKKR